MTVIPDVNPEEMYNARHVEMMEQINKDLNDQLKGRLVSILHCDAGNSHHWKDVEIVVDRIEWQHNSKGYADANGPIIYATDGNTYYFHPDQGIVIIG